MAPDRVQANFTWDARCVGTVCVPGTPLLRSWITEDDEGANDDYHMRLQQLESDAATCLHNLSELNGLVYQDQADIDEVERHVQTARENTEACVEVLAQRRKQGHSNPHCKWLLPIAGGVVLGAVVPISAPLGTLIIAKATIASAGAAVSKFGQLTASKVGQSQLRRDDELAEKMQTDLAQVNLSLTLDEQLQVISFGDEVCARFLKAMRRDWRRVYLSRRATINAFTMYKSASSCRAQGTFVNGNAYMIEFEVSAMPVVVFREVLRKQACVSIDPGCAYSWDVPVEGDFGRTAQTTSLRSVLLPRAFYSRNLFLVSRTCQDITAEGVERYILASGSPPGDKIPKQFQRMPSTGCEAHCHFTGVLVENIGSDRSRVRLAVDADPRVPVGGNRQADLVVRMRLIEMARRLRSGLGAPAETPLNSLIA